MSPEAAPREVPCAVSLTFDEAFALMMSQADPLEISEVPLAEAFGDALQAKGIQPCIPGRRSRNKRVRYDNRRYRRRSRIEIMFGRLKDWRRVATRYDRCPTAFLLRRQPGCHCHLLALINES